MRVEHVEEIEAPLSAVWDLTLDVESWPSITPTMTRIEPLTDPPLQVGSRVKINQPGQRARIWTVTALENERRFAWSTTAIGMTLTGEHRLTPSINGTTNTLVVEFSGPMTRVLGPLLKRPIGKAIATENAGFKAAAERAGPLDVGGGAVS